MTQPHYWDEVEGQMKESRSIHAWRAYMRAIYQRLIKDWLNVSKETTRLKTDLFEEAVSPHHPLSDLGEGTIGLDLSLNVVRSAQKALLNGADNTFLVADLRNIPLQSESIDRILSGSSLDHFPKEIDLQRSLSELVRILAPAGILVLTLDNPHNPVVWIRNRLPFRFLNWLGILPYYVGETFDRHEAGRQLELNGLRVLEVRAVGHAPRAPAIWLVSILERLGWSTNWLLKTLNCFEVLEKWPTRYLTGYYIALHAIKDSSQKI